MIENDLLWACRDLKIDDHSLCGIRQGLIGGGNLHPARGRIAGYRGRYCRIEINHRAIARAAVRKIRRNSEDCREIARSFYVHTCIEIYIRRRRLRYWDALRALCDTVGS